MAVAERRNNPVRERQQPVLRPLHRQIQPRPKANRKSSNLSALSLTNRKANLVCCKTKALPVNTKARQPAPHRFQARAKISRNADRDTKDPSAARRHPQCDQLRLNADPLPPNLANLLDMAKLLSRGRQRPVVQLPNEVRLHNAPRPRSVLPLLSADPADHTANQKAERKRAKLLRRLRPNDSAQFSYASAPEQSGADLFRSTMVR